MATRLAAGVPAYPAFDTRSLMLQGYWLVNRLATPAEVVFKSSVVAIANRPCVRLCEGKGRHSSDGRFDVERRSEPMTL